jgi:hypothetical protein
VSGLAVHVDGKALPEEEARALWQRFSDWMEEHRGDLAGFAAQEGFASVHPGVHAGRPVLLASHQEAQRPYAPVREADDAREGGGGGSGNRQAAPRGGPPRGAKPAKRSGKPRSRGKT